MYVNYLIHGGFDDGKKVVEKEQSCRAEWELECRDTNRHFSCSRTSFYARKQAINKTSVSIYLSSLSSRCRVQSQNQKGTSVMILL